jgi:hypothetical protein
MHKGSQLADIVLIEQLLNDAAPAIVAHEFDNIWGELRHNFVEPGGQAGNEFLRNVVSID